jgi:hypothetical protein
MENKLHLDAKSFGGRFKFRVSNSLARSISHLKPVQRENQRPLSFSSALNGSAEPNGRGL